LWVRSAIGRPLKGWRPYENWANAPGGITEEYLADDGLRLHDGSNPADDGASAVNGLLQIRKAVSVPGASIRLAGLSGVGKTRLVQALFDSRIGEHPLNPSQAFYADISTGPIPDPETFADQLLALRTRAVLIIDNCPPDLHGRLTQVCSNPDSLVSLLSVEYDVRDHLPEETSVFRLEPASDSIIEKLVLKRFAHISPVDGEAISRFSGGNARVAIALANTVEKGETLSGFRDDELFRRLFWQRNETSNSLLVSAEACSLVYSFDGVDTNSDKSEIAFLAELIDKPVNDLYRDVQTLLDRDLVQSRNVWRAVLPQAIANRLARSALNSIPTASIANAFIERAPERLVKSFSRRLSYLHDSAHAVQIVNGWLAHDGWIGRCISNLNTLGIEILRNIAPVSPDRTLDAIERAANGDHGASFTSRENEHHREFVRILGHLAYDQHLFARSVELLLRYTIAEKNEGRHTETRDSLQSLFYIHFSGTLASREIRASVIERLLQSDVEDKREVGFLLLDAALEAWHFSNAQEFSFGARPRDFGYEPQTREEIEAWFRTFIRLCVGFVISEDVATSERAAKILANKLRALWTSAGVLDDIEKAARDIIHKGPWNEGWAATRGIVRYDSKAFDEKTNARLHDLERLLRPNDLLAKARAFALSDQRTAFDLDEDYADEEAPLSGYRRAEATTLEVGIQVAEDPAALDALLPDLVSKYTQRMFIFGGGLAEGAMDRPQLWKRLHDQLARTPAEKRRNAVLRGFLASCAKFDRHFYDSVLDDLIVDPLLGPEFPDFQLTSALDARAIARLHQSLDAGIATVSSFRCLGFSARHESIHNDGLEKILRKILAKEGGVSVVLGILSMRIVTGEKETEGLHSEGIIDVARTALCMHPFDSGKDQDENGDHNLAEIAKVCFRNSDGKPAAEVVCARIADAVAQNQIYSFHYPALFNAIAEAQPIAFLDAFLGGSSISAHQRRRVFSDSLGLGKNPLRCISDNTLLLWCETDPVHRYPALLSVVQVISNAAPPEEPDWLPIVYSILERTSDLKAALDSLGDSVRLTTWRNSRTEVLERSAAVFKRLYDHDSTEVRSWAKTQHDRLREFAVTERERVSDQSRYRNETFE